MARVRVQMNSRGARSLLRSDEVMRDLQRRGRAIASAAGPDMDMESGLTSQRARVAVLARSAKAMRAEAMHKSLTRAIDAGRA